MPSLLLLLLVPLLLSFVQLTVMVVRTSLSYCLSLDYCSCKSMHVPILGLDGTRALGSTRPVRLSLA